MSSLARCRQLVFMLLTLEIPVTVGLQVRVVGPTTRIPLATPTRVSQLYSTVAAKEAEDSSSRRSLLTTALNLPLALAASPQPARAGLIQFPCKTLKNRYHFMRAGPSELEAEGIYSTNPLFLTNRENGLLTTREGKKAVLDACSKIQASPNFPTVAYHSLAANGMDTADIMATELRISRDRLLPEFTYLDQRGIGLWDSGGIDLVRPAIAALDFAEAGRMGMGGRPPPTDDGTPNETLADQFVRLRQFLSLQESRTSGENILIIFPDGTGPALLSAMIAGIPLNEAHCLDYQPGEVRLDISLESVLEQYQARKDDPDYLAMLEDGKKKLAVLREQKGDIVSLKDRLRDEERAVLDREFDLKKQKEREEEGRKKQELVQIQLQKEQERAQRIQLERERLAAERAAIKASSPTTSNDEGIDASVLWGGLGVGVLGLGAAVLLGGSGDDEAGPTVVVPAPVPSPKTNTVVLGANGTAAVVFARPPPFVEDEVTVMELPLPKSASSRVRPKPTRPERTMGEADKEEENEKEPIPDAHVDKPQEAKPSMAIEEELRGLEMAQETLFKTVDSLPPPSIKETETEELNKLDRSQSAMNSYYEMDDGANDWLQVLTQIRDAPDEEADRVNGEGRQ